MQTYTISSPAEKYANHDRLSRGSTPDPYIHPFVAVRRARGEVCIVNILIDSRYVIAANIVVVSQD